MIKHKLLFFQIILIVCLSGAAADMYSPSLPAIATFMDAPLSQVQFSLSVYMVGLAISQLIYGPVSEGLGRRLPLLFGLMLFTGASLVCMMANTISTLIIGRILQGVGVGACSALWRSVFRDVYEGDELAKFIAYLSVAVPFILPSVPIVGGYMQTYFGWRGTFGLLVGYGLMTLCLFSFSFDETSKYHHPSRLKINFVANAVRRLISSRIFVGYVCCIFFSYGAFFSWFTIGPALLMTRVGLNPIQYGWAIFCLFSTALIFGGIVNRKIRKLFGSAFCLRFGWSLMILSALLLMIGQYWHGIHLLSIVMPVFLFIFGAAFIWPNAFAGAFQPFGDIAGYASSIYSFMQMAGGAVIASIGAQLPSTTAYPLAFVFLISSVLSWLIFERIE